MQCERDAQMHRERQVEAGGSPGGAGSIGSARIVLEKLLAASGELQVEERG